MRCDAYVHRMNYCIFSTLPLDVENAVIHTLNAEGVGFCEMGCYVEFEGVGFCEMGCYVEFEGVSFREMGCYIEFEGGGLCGMRMMRLFIV